MNGSIALALLLTTLAGLATTIGSVLGLIVKTPGPKFMGFTLGFSAGVMILVSFVELLNGAIHSIGFLSAHIAFFTGMLLMFAVDASIPHYFAAQKDCSGIIPHNEKLMKTGLLVALGIGIHNFPEGMATFAGSLKDIHLGVAIAVAVAIHNIPEGIAVAVPVYVATGSRKKAFIYSFLSGISEPVGAALGALVLLPVLNETVLNWTLAVVAGLMVYIALDELVPSSNEYGGMHTPILGSITGMLVMALSLWMLA